MTKPTKRLSHARRDDAEAFLPEPSGGSELAYDDAESFAEEFIASVTAADFVLEDARNEPTDDEIESIRAGSWLLDGDAEDERTADA